MTNLNSPKTYLKVLQLGNLETTLGRVTFPEEKSLFIAGAGCVGLAQALALLKQGFTVFLHDPNPLKAWDASKLDLKVFAVNHVNASFLEQIGGWQEIAAQHVNPYDQLTLHVGEQEQTTLFTASEVNLNQLGYMVENAALVNGLLQACQAYGDKFVFLEQVAVEKAVKRLSSTFSIAESYAPQAKDISWEIAFSNGLVLQTNLVIAADGANSFWRKQANIAVDIHSYPTKCMLIEIEGQGLEEFTHLTWQQVDANGPKAWLPVKANHGVLCWYDEIATIDSLGKLSPEQLKTKIKDNFPADKLGSDFTVKQFGSFPLARQRAKHYWQNNVLLVGDAAHTVSPLAGQGLNLGLQDVQCLVRLFADHTFTQLDALGKAYAYERYIDNTLMQEFLSALHHTYISRSPIAKVLRENMYRVSGITAVKHYALNYANGERGLLRGIAEIGQSVMALLGKK
ncbi:hypothetical protein CKF54_06185 [Psittacicella hinzii]|uniref:FAD-binding domain-containing protein n=1 Tax=Psittacicella hinzii TaxID=2028575 RepID=A0A3A1Y2U3_9GAMM|nr:FAD-dependent monooxygenase [Psittacicella hinzii]RIY31740.1 hypothetical protein CKF54_06185 [Psittacicella hinzii]